MKNIFCLIIFGFLLSGCGQSGPLYLPKPKQETPSAKAKTTTSTANTKNNGQSSTNTSVKN